MKKTQSAPNKGVKFLVDSDVDVELVGLLRKLGFSAVHATGCRNIPNDDTEYLKWGREHGYILVNHDKHRDTKTKYSFYSEMYYRGGQVIRVGKPGQSVYRLLGCILAQHHIWQEKFQSDSGEAVVHPSGCKFKGAKELLQMSKYEMRIPFEDPSVPLTTREKAQRQPRRKYRQVPVEQLELASIEKQ